MSESGNHGSETVLATLRSSTPCSKQVPKVPARFRLGRHLAAKERTTAYGFESPVSLVTCRVWPSTFRALGSLHGDSIGFYSLNFNSSLCAMLRYFKFYARIH